MSIEDFDPEKTAAIVRYENLDQLRLSEYPGERGRLRWEVLRDRKSMAGIVAALGYFSGTLYFGLQAVKEIFLR